MPLHDMAKALEYAIEAAVKNEDSTTAIAMGETH